MISIYPYRVHREKIALFAMTEVSDWMEWWSCRRRLIGGCFHLHLDAGDA